MKIQRPREILHHFGAGHTFSDDAQTLSSVCMWIGRGQMYVVALPAGRQPTEFWIESVTARIDDVSLDPTPTGAVLSGRLQFLDTPHGRDMQKLWIEKAIRPAIAGFGNNNRELTRMNYLFWSPRVDIT